MGLINNVLIPQRPSVGMAHKHQNQMNKITLELKSCPPTPCIIIAKKWSIFYNKNQPTLILSGIYRLQFVHLGPILSRTINNCFLEIELEGQFKFLNKSLFLMKLNCFLVRKFKKKLIKHKTFHLFS